MQSKKSTQARGLPILDMPDFFKEAEADVPTWVPYLNDHGVVVVKDVLSKPEVKQAKELYWQFLKQNQEFLQQQFPEDWQEGGELVVNDQRTVWDKNYPVLKNGFSNMNYSCHSESAWFMRTRPAVKRTFEQIYQTDDLIVSFDTIISWRQWWLQDQEAWLPKNTKLHTDQNHDTKRGFHCIQGMLVLEDIDERIGGFEAVPDTANIKTQEYFSKALGKKRGDFVPIPKGLLKDPFFKKKNGLIKAKAGDLILFDSRTVHGSVIGPGYKSSADSPLSLDQFARLAFCVCMTPRAKAPSSIIQQRQEAFKLGLGTTHWPYEFNTTKPGMDVEEGYAQYQHVEVTPQIADLIGREFVKKTSMAQQQQLVDAEFGEIGEIQEKTQEKSQADMDFGKKNSNQAKRMKKAKKKKVMVEQ